MDGSRHDLHITPTQVREQRVSDEEVVVVGTTAGEEEQPEAAPPLHNLSRTTRRAQPNGDRLVC